MEIDTDEIDYVEEEKTEDKEENDEINKELNREEIVLFTTEGYAAE